MSDENKDADISKHPAFVQLTGVVTQLGKNFQTLQGLMAAQGENLNKVVKAIESGGGKPPGGKPPDKEEKQITEKELDEMSQSQLVTHIFKSTRGMLDNLGKSITEKLDGLSTSFEKKNLQTEAERARDAHKDFDDFIPEIKEKITSNPNLNLEEAYTLVRAANPEKAKQMDDKYKVDLEKDKNGEKGNDRPAFGGLMPTSGGPKQELDDDGKPIKSLTAQQAGDKAWEETFGDNPNLAGTDSED